MTNLWIVAAVIAHAAWLREESRGAHLRTDFPANDDARWRTRLTGCIGDDGGITFRHEPTNRTQQTTVT
jgi:L-aspartate oxidase